MANDTRLTVTFPDGSTKDIDMKFFTLIAFTEPPDAVTDAEGRTPVSPVLYQYPQEMAGFTIESIRTCAGVLASAKEPHIKAIGKAIGKAVEMGDEMIDSARNQLADNIKARAQE